MVIAGCIWARHFSSQRRSVLYFRHRRPWQHALRLLLISCLILPLLFDTATACRRNRRVFSRSWGCCYLHQSPSTYCPPALWSPSQVTSMAAPVRSTAEPPAASSKQRPKQAETATPPMRIEHIPLPAASAETSSTLATPAPPAKAVTPQPTPPTIAEAPSTPLPAMEPTGPPVDEQKVDEPKPTEQATSAYVGPSFLERLAEQIVEQVQDAITPPLAAAENLQSMPAALPAEPTTEEVGNFFDELSGTPPADSEVMRSKPAGPQTNFFDELSSSETQANPPATEPASPDQATQPESAEETAPAPSADTENQSVRRFKLSGPIALSHQPQRLWVDASGKHSTFGALTLIHTDAVRIFKDNGRYTTVPLQQLSAHDRHYVAFITDELPPPNSFSQR